MAAVTDLILKNKNSNKIFLFRGVAPLKNRRNQPAMNINLIGTSPANTFLFRFMGQSETVTFTFALFDDGVDVSSGTEATIETVDEQVAYLKDTIYTAGYNHYWTVYQTRYYPVETNCVITNLELDNPAGGVDIITGTITLMIGRIGAV